MTKNKLVCECGNDRFIAAEDGTEITKDKFVCTECGQLVIAYKPNKRKEREYNYYYEYKTNKRTIEERNKSY